VIVVQSVRTVEPRQRPIAAVERVSIPVGLVGGSIARQPLEGCVESRGRKPPARRRNVDKTSDMTLADCLTVSAIDPARLAEIHTSQRDERGNSIARLQAEGWEPLRCCLAFPSPGEEIALISYSPFRTSSPWSETGPVYIHPTPCAGYRMSRELPDRMRTGPKVLRTYRADGTLHYDHIMLVNEGIDLEEPIRNLLAVDEIATVHVRAVHSQCFGYSVRLSGICGDAPDDRGGRLGGQLPPATAGPEVGHAGVAGLDGGAAKRPG
jgi:hypothetical protein